MSWDPLSKHLHSENQPYVGVLVFKAFGKAVATSKVILISFGHKKMVLEVELRSHYRVMEQARLVALLY